MLVERQWFLVSLRKLMALSCDPPANKHDGASPSVRYTTKESLSRTLPKEPAKLNPLRWAGCRRMQLDITFKRILFVILVHEEKKLLLCKRKYAS
jgi:hypothetical protein